MNGWVVFAAILLGIVLLGLILFAVLREKIRRFSSQAFGTPDILQGLSRAQKEADNTPRSLSGGDAIYADRVMRDFPDFNLPLAKSYVEHCVTDFLSAVESGDTAGFCEHYPGKLAALAQSRAEDSRKANKRPAFDRLRFHNTTMARYLKNWHDCTILFQTAFEYLDENGRKHQAKYELAYTRYLQAEGEEQAQQLRCPHCGAPVSALGSKVCAYCGTGLAEIIRQTWQFTNLAVL